MKTLLEVKELMGFICDAFVLGVADTSPVKVDTSVGWNFYHAEVEASQEAPLNTIIDATVQFEVKVHPAATGFYLAARGELKNCTPITE